MVTQNIIGIVANPGPEGYAMTPPYLPHEGYPEFNGRLVVGKERNVTYHLFRQLLNTLNMDPVHFNTHDWNPLGEIIQPGQQVLIKPNLVRHIHLGGGDYTAVVTHGSLIRCVLDYAALALQGKGEVIVGDAPIQSADFLKIVERTGLQAICDDVSKCWQIPVHLVDFRLKSVVLDNHHQVIKEEPLRGDPAGYCRVDLGEQSLLAPISLYHEKYRVTNYDCSEMREHHNEKRNEYLIPRAVLESDVVINLPKLKTHRKVGLTAALKNMVGINGYKDWLPHHRFGSIKDGGDEYQAPSFFKRIQTHLGKNIDLDPLSNWNPMNRLMIRFAGWLSRCLDQDPYLEGSWYGNNTLWRTVLDLNRILVYADKQGKMTNISQRKQLTIVDAIVAGEGEGPMEPDARPCSLLVGGSNPVAVDAVLATMIGFDYRKIPLIANAFQMEKWPLINFGTEEMVVQSRDNFWKGLKVGAPCHKLCFLPSSGWLGHIEFDICQHGEIK